MGHEHILPSRRTRLHPDAFRHRRKVALWRSQKSVDSTIGTSDAQLDGIPSVGVHGREISKARRRRKFDRRRISPPKTVASPQSSPPTDDDSWTPHDRRACDGSDGGIGHKTSRHDRDLSHVAGLSRTTGINLVLARVRSSLSRSSSPAHARFTQLCYTWGSR